MNVKSESNVLYAEQIDSAARLYRKAIALSTVCDYVQTLETASEALQVLRRLQEERGQQRQDFQEGSVLRHFVYLMTSKYQGRNHPSCEELNGNESFLREDAGYIGLEW